jgi:hypothetical protein
LCRDALSVQTCQEPSTWSQCAYVDWAARILLESIKQMDCSNACSRRDERSQQKNRFNHYRFLYFICQWNELDLLCMTESNQKSKQNMSSRWLIEDVPQWGNLVQRTNTWSSTKKRVCYTETGWLNVIVWQIINNNVLQWWRCGVALICD